VSLHIPSSSRFPDHDPHRTIYYLGYPLGRFAGLKHRQRGRPGSTPGARDVAGQRGTAATPLHVARQRLPAAPCRQTRPKGSSGANNVCQRLFLKIINKRLKLKNVLAQGLGLLHQPVCHPGLVRLITDPPGHDEGCVWACLGTFNCD
jgi:hypothetical protein